MRASLAALTLLLALLGVAAGARELAGSAAAGAGRRAAAARGGLRRVLQCAQCPDAAAAAAACSAVDRPRHTAIRNTLIASCSTAALDTGSGSCCDVLAALPPADWQTTLACLCAGDAIMPGLSAFVGPAQVLGACGCRVGAFSGASPTAGAAASATPPAPPSAAANATTAPQLTSSAAALITSGSTLPGSAGGAAATGTAAATAGVVPAGGSLLAPATP